MGKEMVPLGCVTNSGNVENARPPHAWRVTEGWRTSGAGVSEPRPWSHSLAELDADCIHSFGHDHRKPWSPQRRPDAHLL